MSKAGARRAPLVRVSAPERHESRMAMRMSAGAAASRCLSVSKGSRESPSRSAPSFAWPE